MNKTQFIAEVSSNHGGNMALAKEFIRIAAQVGVDYVKFQSWQVARLADGPKDPQYDWLVKAELTDAMHRELMEECAKQGVKFLTAVFDIHRVDFLASLGLKEIKVPSPNLSSYRMLEALRNKFEHVILSTGMHEEAEIRQAAEVLKGSRFTFMHCVAVYPAGPETANLARMDWLRQFTTSVGYSDHVVGLDAAKVAIARGAAYVERHFSLGKYGPGRSNVWDTTPEQMEELVKYAERVHGLLGDGSLSLGEAERKSRERFLHRWGNDG
jgi:N,N'-diacetyllegionaminate synthase